jgi:hypothetical protein
VKVRGEEGRANRHALLVWCADHVHLSPYYVAQTEARLGNRREAIRYLTICVQSHDEVLLNLIDDQVFISLHGDPAFQQLLAKIGLPPVSFTPKKNQSEDLSLRAPESSG